MFCSPLVITQPIWAPHKYLAQKICKCDKKKYFVFPQGKALPLQAPHQKKIIKK